MVLKLKLDYIIYFEDRACFWGLFMTKLFIIFNKRILTCELFTQTNW